MQKLKYTIFILIFLFTISSESQGQQYSVSSKKAIKLFEEGLRSFELYELDKAVENLKKAIDKESQFIEAYSVLAVVYTNLHKNDLAREQLKKALSINDKLFPENYFNLAILEMSEGNYKDALSNYQSYIAVGRPGPEQMGMANKEIENCLFALEAIKNPVPFDPKNMGPEINSDLREYFPVVSTDNNLLIYTRQLVEPSSPAGFNEDFYVSYKQDGKWVQSRNLGAPINSINNEGAPTLSPDGQYLIFTACELYGDYGENRKGMGSCDLFASRKAGDKWGRPVNIKTPVNTVHWETQPSFSSDGKTMYFIRGKNTGRGIKEQDIYVASLNDQGTWGKPERLSPRINTPGREESVFIHPDGKTLYFSSDGHVGMGGLDIYVARKDQYGKWGNPVNLGYPINTFNDENSLLVSSDGKTAYFASDREGGYGLLDLYSFELPEFARPEIVTYMKGHVYDKATNESLEAKFELIDHETGELVVSSRSNPVNGEFLVSLPVNHDYALNVSKKGYLFYSETFLLSESTNSDEAYFKNVPLQKIEVEKPVVLKNVFFDTDKFDLKPKSRIELDKLVSFLEKNAGISIEISGHTDSEGNKSANQILSENRAKSVMTYLQDNGIDENRLTAKGYGDSSPIDTNDSPEGRAKNRRTEFKIVKIE